MLALEIHGWGEVGRVRFHNMCEEHLQHDMLSPASLSSLLESHLLLHLYVIYVYDSLSDVGEIRVYQRADFQSGSRVLKKVF